MPFLILAFLSFLSATGYVPQATTGHAIRNEDRVIIKPRRIVLKRSGQLAKQFPDRKTAVVTYPIISGLSNPAVLRKVRTALEIKNVFDSSLNEYRDDGWLTEFGYVVNYNSNYMLDITFRQSGMGAYPDEASKHFLLSLKDGHIVKAVDVFQSDKLAALAALVDRRLQRELKEIATENAQGASAEDIDSIRQAHEPLKFKVQNLDDFSVGRSGVTFLYDADFPHVIQAWEPNGRYFVSYAALRDYIKRDGLLGRFKG
jgi:hypothetical protein